MSPQQIYADNVGHTHEAAVSAVFDAGVKEGRAQLEAELIAQQNDLTQGSGDDLSDKGAGDPVQSQD